jgi:hypothetical protein
MRKLQKIQGSVGYRLPADKEIAYAKMQILRRSGGSENWHPPPDWPDPRGSQDFRGLQRVYGLKSPYSVTSRAIQAWNGAFMW